jgi:hypothetical protein
MLYILKPTMSCIQSMLLTIINITLTKQKKQKTKKSFNESFIERFFYCVIIESLTQKYRSVIISLLDFLSI